jgi:hypothetical protein
MKKLIIKNRYATIPNDLVNSTEISLKAKGLFAYIQSKPDGWEFSAERISNQLKEGLPTINSALKELESNGFLRRERYQNEYGHWMINYLLCEIPVAENLTLGNPLQENPDTGKPSNNTKQYLTNKESNKTIKEKVDFSDLMLPHLDIFDLLGDEFENFKSYWTEPDKKGKQRWENEKYFDIRRRIKTWMINKTKYDKPTDKPRGTSIDRMEALRNW